MRNEKKSPSGVHVVWALGGCYLLYLAIQLFRGVVTGTSETPALGIVGGGAFVAAGVWLLYRTWSAYRSAVRRNETEEEDRK